MRLDGLQSPPPCGAHAAARARFVMVPWGTGDVWNVVSARGGARQPASPARSRGCGGRRGDDSGSEAGEAADARSDAGSASTSAEVSCRFCFGEADAEAEGELVSPCLCMGTQVRRDARARAARGAMRSAR